jgi:hypothetical protein
MFPNPYSYKNAIVKKLLHVCQIKQLNIVKKATTNRWPTLPNNCVRL